MVEFTLEGFEVEKSFSYWKVRVKGDLLINGLKTRVFDYFTFEEVLDKTGIENPKEMTFNQAEKVFGIYYRQKVSG
jgi:hypothetical protein